MAIPSAIFFAKDQNISLHKFVSQDEYGNFYTPLSDLAAEQWTQLSQLLLAFTSSRDEDDQWVYIWGSQHFSPNKAYLQTSGFQLAHPVFKWMWK